MEDEVGKNPITRDHGETVVVVRLLLSGYFGRGNVGDDAMLDAFVSVVRGNPRFATVSKSLPSAGLLNLSAALSFVDSLWDSDALVIVGGTHLHGSLGRRSTRILFQFWMLFTLARMLGKQVCLAGMGIELPRGRADRFLLRRCLALVSIVLLRDEESDAVVAGVAPTIRRLLGIDLAFILADRVSELLDPKPREDKLIVSVLPYGSLREFGSASHERLLDMLAAAIDALPVQLRPARVQILCMYSGRQPNDVEVARSLAARVRTIPVDTTMAFTAIDAMGEISSARAILTGRYHALLFAFLVGTPVGAISHQPKVTSLCRVIGLPRHQWLSFDEALVKGALKDLLVATMQSARVPPRQAELAAVSSAAVRQFLDEVGGKANAGESR